MQRKNPIVKFNMLPNSFQKISSKIHEPNQFFSLTFPKKNSCNFILEKYVVFFHMQTLELLRGDPDETCLSFSKYLFQNTTRVNKHRVH